MLSLARRVYTSFDWFLHQSAALLGASLKSKLARRGLFLCGTVLLLLVAALAPAPVALVAVCLNLWLLISVYWTWSCNESVRGRIAKKIDRTDPDSMPRLADIAIFTSLLTPVVLLFLFENAQNCFHLYSLDRAVLWYDWLYFVLQKTYLKALPDSISVAGFTIDNIHKSPINYLNEGNGALGRVLVSLAYLLLYTILIQGIWRWWQVRRDIADAIAGVAEDPDMAVRLGRRAARPLLRAWNQGDLPAATRANMARALGRIGHQGAIPVLEETALNLNEPPEVRAACLLALGQIGGPRAASFLGTILLKPDNEEVARARAAAANGLGYLSDPAATPPLLEKLERVQAADRRKMDHPEVRKAVVEALGRHLARRRDNPPDNPGADISRAVVLILCGEGKRSLLQDAYLRVRNRAATAVSYLADSRALEPLTLLVQENDNPKLLQAGTEALGRLLGTLSPELQATPEALAAREELLRHLRESTNDSVRESSVRGLGYARAAVAVPLLWQVLERSLRYDQESLSEAATEALLAIDPTTLPRISLLEHQVGRENSQRRRLTVLGDMYPLEERLRAARELGEYADRRGRQALARIADNEAAPPDLREACREALARIRSAPRV